MGLLNKSDCVKLHPAQLSPEYQPDGISSVVKANHYIAQCYQDGYVEFFWTHRANNGDLIDTYVKLRDISCEDKKLIIATLIDFRDIQRNVNKQLPQIHDLESINYNLLNEHKKIIDFSSIVSKTDVSGKIIYANSKFCDITGYAMEELLGNDHSIINHPDVPKSLFGELWKTIRSGKIWQGVIQNRKKNGDSYFVDSTISPIFNTDGEIVEFIAIRNDITSLVEKEEVIVFQNTDSQSKLPNKTKLYNDLRSDGQAMVAVIDVFELESLNHICTEDDFKQLVLDVVDALNKFVGQGVRLYRTAEYQFAILSNIHEHIEAFIAFCKNISSDFDHSYFLCADKRLNLSLFIGVAENLKGMDPFINANQANKLAEGSCQKLNVFKPQRKVLKAIEESVGWTQSIKQALHGDGFTIFGQQIVDAQQQVYSTEVLMRHYDRETGAFTSPYFFLDYACKAKLYNKLTQLVMEKSFAHFAQVSQRFSINMTYMDLCDQVTMALLEQLLERYQCGAQLTIELVESDSLDIYAKDFKAFLALIKKFGCLLAIDDFGSGYSNFNYLTQIPVDIVKIDGSLVQDIDVNERHFLTVKAIVDICHALKIKVVAEYVANDSIYQKLLLLNIEYFQGFLFDEPKPLLEKIVVCEAL